MEWYYWITLTVAIIAPTATTLLTNRHRRKLFNDKLRSKKLAKCNVLVGELVKMSTCRIEEYRGISTEALQAAGFLDTYNLKLLSAMLAAAADTELQRLNNHRYIGDVCFKFDNKEYIISETIPLLCCQLADISLLKKLK